MEWDGTRSEEVVLNPAAMLTFSTTELLLDHEVHDHPFALQSTRGFTQENRRLNCEECMKTAKAEIAPTAQNWVY